MTELPNNLWKSQVIKDRLYAEACFECDRGIADKSYYWVLVPQADIRADLVELKNYKPSITDVDPHEVQIAFAKDLQLALQKEAHFDGLWIVGYTHPPTTYETLTDTGNCWSRLIMLWLDTDGDPQYTLESDLNFHTQLEHGVEYYIKLAHDAHKQFEEQFSQSQLKKDMMLKEEEQRREALEALK